MSSFICRQPNGLLCRFSTVVDTVTHYNMTDEEYIQYRMELARKDAEDTIKNGLSPFRWIDKFFIDSNMTEEEFNQIKAKMCEPKGENKKECSTCKSDNSLENCLWCIKYGHWELKGDNNPDCRNCDKWKTCENGEKGHTNGTSIGYSIGECRDYAELKGENK